ncbi:helix-turn-helix domain-containing protein [Intestinibacter sp.]
MDIGIRIKNLRKQSGLTQFDLANSINKSKSTVEKYEAGKIENIPASTLKKIAQALGVTLEDLLKEEIEDNKRYWQALKSFQVGDIRSLIEELESYNLPTSDKNIVKLQKDIIMGLVYQYEQIIQPLSKELLSDDIDIIYGDKLKAAINTTKLNLDAVENTLKIIKDRYLALEKIKGEYI